jgi:hypothetical protein
VNGLHGDQAECAVHNVRHSVRERSNNATRGDLHLFTPAIVRGLCCDVGLAHTGWGVNTHCAHGKLECVAVYTWRERENSARRTCAFVVMFATAVSLGSRGYIAIYGRDFTRFYGV